MAPVPVSHSSFACLDLSFVTSGIAPHEASAQSRKATKYDRQQDTSNERQFSSRASTVASMKAATATIVRGLGGTVSPTGAVVLPGTLSGSEGEREIRASVERKVW